ncbi:transcription factor Adf-1-like [Eucyclogobius newberryi]|uniref:transcription factor Adf-1-like n=1 Tax=Eucyclogobius newberryi TaxID=166745 RepID=UPI003B59B2DC
MTDMADETLIVAVCGLKELYDVGTMEYRNRRKKDQAWRKVSEETGLSEEFCRKRWKSLRDTYMKERKKEREKRSGSAAGSAAKWRYSGVMSFLDPFITPRESSGNMERRVEEAEDPGEPEDAAEGLSESGLLYET